MLKDHDDVIKWKHFPRYLLFVRGIHRSPSMPHAITWINDDPVKWRINKYASSSSVSSLGGRRQLSKMGLQSQCKLNRTISIYHFTNIICRHMFTSQKFQQDISQRLEATKLHTKVFTLTWKFIKAEIFVQYTKYCVCEKTNGKTFQFEWL